MPVKQILRKRDKERVLEDTRNLKLKQCSHASFYLAPHDCREIGPFQGCCVNNGTVHQPLILSCLHPLLINIGPPTLW